MMWHSIDQLNGIVSVEFAEIEDANKFNKWLETYGGMEMFFDAVKEWDSIEENA
jgi:hypothetical protein